MSRFSLVHYPSSTGELAINHRCDKTNGYGGQTFIRAESQSPAEEVLHDTLQTGWNRRYATAQPRRAFRGILGVWTRTSGSYVTPPLP